MQTESGKPAARLFRISGRVQGVCFRASTQEQARRLGLSGWVKNCPDGSVEAYACGGQDQLDALEHWLAQGPAMAKVENVAVSEQQAEPSDGFVITY